MSGPSLEFLAFALVAALLTGLSRRAAVREAVLLLASLYFLSSFSGDLTAFWPLAAFLAAGYLALEAVRRAPDRAFVPALLLLLVLFVWLKKYSFVPASLWLQAPYVTIGLSYVLFRLLHLVIETRYGALPVRVGPLSYLAYLLNFTTLVAGPIQRYEEFAAQSGAEGRRWPSAGEAVAGLERIVIGLFKCTVLASVLSQVWTLARDRLVGGCTMDGLFIDAIAAFAVYPFFLYCNFSGYIDIVIGIAALLRRQLPENFNRPFSAGSVIEFWNRWHMTLSAWLKTYVYTPLLMALGRRFPSRALESTWAVLAFFVTFFLVGVWHGQTSEFVCFGFLTGLGMSVNKMYQIVMQRRLGKKRYTQLSRTAVYTAVARGITISWFAFTLLWFWGTWSQLQLMFDTVGAGRLAAVWAAILVMMMLVLWAWETARASLLQPAWAGLPLAAAPALRVLWVLLLAGGTAAMALFSAAPPPEIVYKAF